MHALNATPPLTQQAWADGVESAPPGAGTIPTTPGTGGWALHAHPELFSKPIASNMGTELDAYKQLKALANQMPEEHKDEIAQFGKQLVDRSIQETDAAFQASVQIAANSSKDSPQYAVANNQWLNESWLKDDICIANAAANPAPYPIANHEDFLNQLNAAIDQPEAESPSLVADLKRVQMYDDGPAAAAARKLHQDELASTSTSTLAPSHALLEEKYQQLIDQSNAAANRDSLDPGPELDKANGELNWADKLSGYVHGALTAEDTLSRLKGDVAQVQSATTEGARYVAEKNLEMDRSSLAFAKKSFQENGAGSKWVQLEIPRIDAALAELPAAPQSVDIGQQSAPSNSSLFAPGHVVKNS